MPPQAWTKQDVPQDYAFRPFYGNDPELWKQGEASSTLKYAHVPPMLMTI